MPTPLSDLLTTDRPLDAWITAAEAVVAAHAAAGDRAAEAAGRLQLLTALAWHGAIEAAAAQIARLRAMTVALPALARDIDIHGAELDRLAGDRGKAAAGCAAAWDAIAADTIVAAREGRPLGLLLGCWALAERSVERRAWCLATGDGLAHAMQPVDRLCFLAHAVDAAIEDGDPAPVMARAAALAVAFPAALPLVAFLVRRARALAAADAGGEGEALAAELAALAAEAERRGWRLWLPALDVALAVV